MLKYTLLKVASVKRGNFSGGKFSRDYRLKINICFFERKSAVMSQISFNALQSNFMLIDVLELHYHPKCFNFEDKQITLNGFSLHHKYWELQI